MMGKINGRTLDGHASTLPRQLINNEFIRNTFVGHTRHSTDVYQTDRTDQTDLTDRQTDRTTDSVKSLRGD